MDVFSYVLSHVDLPALIEEQSGVSMKYGRDGSSAICICPYPSHKDSKPSFHLNLNEENIWLFKCYGCNETGNAVHYCQHCLNLDMSSRYDIIRYLAEKFGINIDDIDENSKEVKAAQEESRKKAELYKKLHLEHIITSNQCRLVLRKNVDNNAKWVCQAYKKMNKAIEEQDLATIEAISRQALKKIRE